jgi:trigger factor
VFKCLIHEIKEEELPELDDEFAKDVSEFDTFAEYRQSVADQLMKTKESHVQTQMKDKALEKVYEANDINVPDVMVEDEISNMMQEFDQQLRMQGMDLQKYCQYLNKEMKDFQEELKDDAFKRVKTRMLVAAVADAENIEVTEAEVDEQIDAMAKQYKMEPEKIRESLGIDNISFIEKDLKMKKAVDYIFENAVINE